MIFFNTILRFLMECYLELSISSMVQVRSINWNNESNTFAIAFAIFIFVLIIAYPFFTIIFLTRNFKKLEDHAFEQTYGSLFENIKVKFQMNIYFSFLFLFRRLIFCLAAVFFEDYPVL